MNIEALKLVLKHSYKIPIENFSMSDWSSDVRNRYIGEYTPGKKSRQECLDNKVTFDVVGWSCMFKSMSKLGLGLDQTGLPRRFHPNTNTFGTNRGWGVLYDFFGLKPSEYDAIFETSNDLNEIRANLKNAIKLCEATND